MKWKVRPGFIFFDSPDQEIEYRAGNLAISPRGLNGKILILTPEQLRTICERGMLGALIPADEEADKFFGNTRPLVARGIRTRRPAQVDDSNHSQVPA